MDQRKQLAMHPRIKNILQVRGVKFALEVAFILIVFIAIKTYLQRDLVEGKIPPLQGVLLDGQTINLESLQGKPVLLYFWATWCPVCKMQQDTIADISKDHTVISVAMNSGNDQEVNDYLQKNDLHFPVITDQHSDIARVFGVSGVPTSFIIDPDSRIAFTETGYTTEWGLHLRLWMAQ